MLQLEKFDDINDKLFYLNKGSLEEIKSYTILTNEIPEYFNKNFELSNIDNFYVLLVEAGIDDDGNEFPETYILIEDLNDDDCAIILGIYADDLQYIRPLKGEKIVLKKLEEKKKQQV